MALGLAPPEARAVRRRLGLRLVPRTRLIRGSRSSAASRRMVWRSSSRFSWIEAITGPIATPRSTSTASDSCSELSSVSGTASVTPAL